MASGPGSADRPSALATRGLVSWRDAHASSLEWTRERLVDLWERADRLPASSRRGARRGLSLALALLPAVDPARCPWRAFALPPPAPPRLEPGAVLITGATGFLGTHLVSHLLRETDRKLVCTVRAPEKLERAAREYGLALPGLAERVRFLPGTIRDLARWLAEGDPAWDAVAPEIEHVFHLACNTAFTAQYEILRRQWMPVFAGLCAFAAERGAALHLVGSVGRFAVTAPPQATTRGVWTSCYMRLKQVQCEMMLDFLARGMAGSVTDCAYIIGSGERGVHPGMHDSLWLVAALQTEVGVGFPGDAAVVPVDLLVRGLWANATLPPERRAPYMNLRLERLLTSADIGLPRRVEPAEFWALAEQRGLPRRVIEALVPTDLDVHVRRMNSRPFEGPPEVKALFAGLDEEAILARNVQTARPDFGELRARLAALTG